MSWPTFFALCGGGLWTLFCVGVGINIGKAPYTPPRDARDLK